jgi:hypothetical protein
MDVTVVISVMIWFKLTPGWTDASRSFLIAANREAEATRLAG